jgi:hypothetical protein
MTLCIAAHAKDGSHPCIVCCCDTRIETSTAGSEIGNKLRSFGTGWGALISGTIPDAYDLVEKYVVHLSTPRPTPHWLDWLRVPAWKYKEFLVDQYLRATYAISREDFYSDNRGHLGETVADQTLYEIARIESGCELILFRITDSRSYIFHVNNRFEVRIEADFCSIGTGATNADSWLHFREQNALMSRNDTIYSLYEAKRFSEISPAVGKRTVIDVIEHTGQGAILYPPGMKELERRYEQYGPRTIKQGEFGLDSEMFVRVEFGLDSESA